MKMKKVVSVMLAVMMTAAMTAGCGAAGAKGGSDTFKIGVIGPLTGGAAAYGTAVQYAAEIAVE